MTRRQTNYLWRLTNYGDGVSWNCGFWQRPLGQKGGEVGYYYMGPGKIAVPERQLGYVGVHQRHGCYCLNYDGLRGAPGSMKGS